MKRISIIGLSLVTMLALSATSAPSAFAGEVFVCVKTAKVGKQYTDMYDAGACLSSALSATSEGKYERDSPAGLTYTVKTKKVRLRTAYSSIECKSGTGKGEWTGFKTGVDATTFVGCALGGGKCTSLEPAGTPAGSIVVTSATKLLDYPEVGPGGKGPTEGKVWQSFESLSGFNGDQSVYECEPSRKEEGEGVKGIIFRTYGVLAAPIGSINVAATKRKVDTTYAAPSAEQGLLTETSKDGGETWRQLGPFEQEETTFELTGPKMVIASE